MVTPMDVHTKDTKSVLAGLFVIMWELPITQQWASEVKLMMMT